MKPIIILIIIISLLIAAGFVTMLYYGPIMVQVFASANGLDISYAKIETQGLTVFSITGLKSIEKKSGIGIVAGDAQIVLGFKDNDPRAVTADFVLKNVRFVKKGTEKAISYNNIDGLVALPFNELWIYKEISGHVSPTQDGIFIRDFMATGDEVKFSFNGSITRAKVIDADIGIYFQSKVIGNIPPDLTNMVLADSGQGWKSLLVKLAGDLSKPSIRVTGKLFRLNIGVKQ